MNAWKRASKLTGGRRPHPHKQFVREALHRANRRQAKVALKKGVEPPPEKRLDEREVS